MAMTFEKTVLVTIKIDIDTNDVFNWLTRCDNPETLRYLGKYALKLAQIIENPDDDNFKSRA